MKVMTVVSGMVPDAKAGSFERDYAKLARGPLTPGLVRSQLLKKPDDVNFVYRIETLWESREMLDKMKARPEPPEAVRLFLKVGNPPSVELFELAGEVGSGPDAAAPTRGCVP